jgi:hypothetical protein
MQQNQLSEALLENTAKLDNMKIREWAGITDAVNGADSALTYAVNLKREAEGKLINERTQLMKHFKLNGEQRQMLAVGKDVANVIDSMGNAYTFRASDEYARDAAIELQFKTGSFDDVMAIVAQSGKNGSAYDFRTTIADAIPANGIPAKGLFMGGQFIDMVSRGEINGREDLVLWAAKSIAKGKIKAEDLANNDASALTVFYEAAQTGSTILTDPKEAADFAVNLTTLKDTAAHILDESTDLDRHATQAAKDALDKISKL